MTRDAAPAALLKALAHPARLQIAQILRRGEACVCHLESRLGLRQPYISQQLTVLRNAGLLEERREGTYVFYRLADERVGRVLDVVAAPQAGAGEAAGGPTCECSCPQCASVPSASGLRSRRTSEKARATTRAASRRSRPADRGRA